mmetsp:Transcript_6983/g.11394  ORF Transcript_6983/g.11394 Transcript_6983/m.11394 type:complete len:232 (+) Transcript_6983:92-787(+)
MIRVFYLFGIMSWATLSRCDSRMVQNGAAGDHCHDETGALQVTAAMQDPPRRERRFNRRERRRERRYPQGTTSTEATSTTTTSTTTTSTSTSSTTTTSTCVFVRGTSIFFIGPDGKTAVPPDANITVFNSACPRESISGDVKVEMKWILVGGSLPSVGFTLTSPSNRSFTSPPVPSTSPKIVNTSAFDGDQVRGNWNLIIDFGGGPTIFLSEAVISFIAVDCVDGSCAGRR